MNFQPPNPRELPDPANQGYPQAVEAYLARLLSYYNSRASWHRRCYRFSGIVVILIGASLPLITTQSYAHKDLVVSLMGVAIAVLTALRAFYRWEQSWMLLRGTERTITGAWWDYHAKISKTNGADQRHEAAHSLAERLLDIRQQEAEFFFKDMQFPSGKEIG
jgi:uncharacterized protein DUF4231